MVKKKLANIEYKTNFTITINDTFVFESFTLYWGKVLPEKHYNIQYIDIKCYIKVFFSFNFFKRFWFKFVIYCCIFKNSLKSCLNNEAVPRIPYTLSQLPFLMPRIFQKLFWLQFISIQFNSMKLYFPPEGQLKRHTFNKVVIINTQVTHM